MPLLDVSINSTFDSFLYRKWDNYGAKRDKRIWELNTTKKLISSANDITLSFFKLFIFSTRRNKNTKILFSVKLIRRASAKLKRNCTSETGHFAHANYDLVHSFRATFYTDRFIREKTNETKSGEKLNSRQLASQLTRTVGLIVCLAVLSLVQIPSNRNFSQWLPVGSLEVGEVARVINRSHWLVTLFTVCPFDSQ